MTSFFQIKTLKDRILLAFGGLVILSQLLSIFVFDYIALANARELIHKDLKKKAVHFERLIHNRFDDLNENASLLVGDFAFKTAIATQDHDTVLSALYNQQGRISSNLMAVYNPKNNFLSATIKRDDYNEFNTIIRPFIAASQTSRDVQSGVITFHDRAYQLVVLPVRAPQPIAYLVIGFLLNNNLAAEWSRILDSDVIFLVAKTEKDTRMRSGSISSVHAVASSTMDFDFSRIAGALGYQSPEQINEKEDVVIQTFAIRAGYLGDNFYGVLQKSWREILDEYTTYRSYLWFLAGVLLSLAMLVAYHLSSRISKSAQYSF